MIGPISSIAAFVYVSIDQAQLIFELQLTRPDNQTSDPMIAFRTTIDVGNAIGEKRGIGGVEA